jgi:hypothetical protein
MLELGKAIYFESEIDNGWTNTANLCWQ